jgi:long-chain acyl-CoA synthetase
MENKFNTVLDALLFHAKTTSDKIAVIDREGKTTYRGLAAAIANAAGNLRDLGVRKGGRVMIAAVPYARFAVAYFACHYIGAVAVPVDKNAVKDTLIWMKGLLETEFVFFEGELSEELHMHTLSGLLTEHPQHAFPPENIDQEDLADIVFTSATTGKPKGVMLTHKNILCSSNSLVNTYNISTDAVWCDPAPLNHAGTLRRFRGMLYAGVSLVKEDGYGSIKNIYNTIKQNKCTAISAPATAINLFYEETKNNIYKLLGSLQIIQTAGMPVSLDLKKRLLEDLPDTDIISHYGSTEASAPVFISYRKRLDKLASVGFPVHGVNIKIIDDEDREIKSSPENPGRIAVRSDTVMKGYWKDEARTKKSFTQDGWFIMSDLGYVDDDGFLYILGRTDDVINIGGKKISPLELEDVVNKFTGITECCCIGVDDPEGISGQVPVIFVVADDKQAFSERALYDYLKRHLEHYKLPYKIINIGSIPKNAAGKMLRRELLVLWHNIVTQELKKL